MTIPRASISKSAADSGATGLRVWPGRPAPLGANCIDGGINFALFSEHATKVELCLFRSPDSATESRRITLPERTHQVWLILGVVVTFVSFTALAIRPVV